MCLWEIIEMRVRSSDADILIMLKQQNKKGYLNWHSGDLAGKL